MVANLASRGAALLLLAACGGSQPAPDVVVLLIDTLRPDHLGFHGYARETAPFLAGLARESVIFERAFSTSSWTAPATASVFTGLYPNRHGVTDGFRAQRRRWREAGETRQLTLQSLPGAVPTLPERFRAAGYRTFGLAANINVEARTGFARGFDRFRSQVRADAEAMARLLDDWEVELQAAGPSFVYLHFMDVHEPLHARAPWYEEAARRPYIDEMKLRYESEIHYLDAQLAALTARFRWDRDAILLVISDHGEEFLEHGSHGHGFSLHGEVNRVLMLLHDPVNGFAPRVVDANVSLVDVLPTLCELAGLSAPEPSDGRSLVPLLRAADRGVPPPFRDRTLFAHRAHRDGSPEETRELWAAIQGSWKLIRGDTPDPDGELLYQLEEDPGETRDLSDERPEVAARLRGRLERFRAAAAQLPGEPVDVTLDAETLEHLRELGYVNED